MNYHLPKLQRVLLTQLKVWNRFISIFPFQPFFVSKINHFWPFKPSFVRSFIFCRRSVCVFVVKNKIQISCSQSLFMHSGTVVWPPQFREKATPLVTLSLSSSSLQRSFYLLPRICAIVCRLHHLFCVSTVAEAVTTVVKVLPLPQSSVLF